MHNPLFPLSLCSPFLGFLPRLLPATGKSCPEAEGPIPEGSATPAKHLTAVSICFLTWEMGELALLPMAIERIKWRNESSLISHTV